MARNVVEIVIKATDNASATFKKVTDNFNSSMTDAGKRMAKTGMLLGGSMLPAVGALGVAVKTASEFSASMTNVQAVLGATDGQMRALSDDILAVGANTRQGPQAVAEAFYDIVGGVADASTHMAILEAAVSTAQAGSADLGGTTSALIAVMNSYGYAASDAAFASDVLTQTVGMGVGTMDEFAMALPQVAGLASSLGISFDDLGSGMAFMTTKGFTAAESATKLRAMMTAMLNPNEQMKQSFREAGFASADLAIEQYGLVGAYQQLAAASPTFQTNMAAAVGSVEALGGVIALTDDAFVEFNDDFIDGTEGATAAAEAIQMDSFAAQMDLLKSSIAALTITMGNIFLPMLTKFVQLTIPIVTGLIRWVKNHETLVRSLGRSAAIIAAFGGSLVVVGGVLAGLGTALAFIASPLGLVVAAFVGLSYAFDRMAAINTNLVPGLKNAIMLLGEGSLEGALISLDLAFGLTYGTMQSWVDTIVGIPAKVAAADFSGVMTTVSDALASVGLDTTVLDLTTLSTSLSSALSNLTLDVTSIDFGPLASTVGNHLFDIIKLALPLIFGGGFLGMAASAVVMAISSDFLGLRTAIENSTIGQKLTDAVGFIPDTINGVLESIGSSGEGEGGGGSNALSGVISGITDALSPLWDYTLEAVQPLIDGISSLASGVVGFLTAFKDTQTSNIVSTLKAIAEGLLALLGAVGKFALFLVGGIIENFGNFLPKFGEALSGFVTGIDQILGGNFVEGLTTIGNAIIDFISGWANLSIHNIVTLINSILGLVGLDVSTITTALSDIGTAIYDEIVGAFNDMVTAVSTAIFGTGEAGDTSLIGTITSIPTSITDAIGDFATFITDTFVSPFTSAVTAIIEAFTGIGQDILDKITEELNSVGDIEIPVLGISLNDVGGAIGGLLGMDSGGHVNPGQGYIVGTGAQPELFVPNTAGRMYPAGTYATTSGGGGASYNLDGATIVVNNPANIRQLLDDLGREARRQNRTARAAL